MRGAAKRSTEEEMTSRTRPSGLIQLSYGCRFDLGIYTGIAGAGQPMPASLYCQRMRNLSARLLLGSALLLAGFGLLGETSLVHRLADVFDMKDRQCRYAPTAVGAACPTGCVARPPRSSAERAAPTICHSRTWIATCGKACTPSEGFARTPEGGLADSGKLVVTLKGEPSAELERTLEALDVTLAPRFDGLYRYDAIVAGGDIEKTRKRLAAMPEVSDIGYVLK